LWGGNTKLDSENFEVNDFAQLNGADGWMTNANLRYRETVPGKVFRSYYFQVDTMTDATLRCCRAAHQCSAMRTVYIVCSPA